MPKHLHPNSRRFQTPSFAELIKPLQAILMTVSPFESRGNKPLEVTFEHMLKSLIFFHLEVHTSGRHLLQVLQKDEFARNEDCSARWNEEKHFL